MFQSYSYSYSNSCSIITVIDSDFKETIDDKNTYWVECFIEIYSRRNLNVALNIVLFIQYRNKECVDDSLIDWQISFYKKHVKDFDKYLPEINKYLSLI